MFGSRPTVPCYPLMRNDLLHILPIILYSSLATRSINSSLRAWPASWASPCVSPSPTQIYPQVGQICGSVSAFTRTRLKSKVPSVLATCDPTISYVSMTLSSWIHSMKKDTLLEKAVTFHGKRVQKKGRTQRN